MDVSRLRGERILDIGCDTGAFLSRARSEFGVCPVGVDVAGQAVAIAREQGIEAYQTTIEQAPEHLTHFPLITAIDVIEHVPAPREFLGELLRRVRPGGLVFLQTPNIRSMVYRISQCLAFLTGSRPLAFFERVFPAQHVQYFTPESLARFAQEVGFQVIQSGTHVLPASDIAVSIPVLVPMQALQFLDTLLRREILIWSILRRPESAGKEEIV